jgi:hypothetical protein
MAFTEICKPTKFCPLDFIIIFYRSKNSRILNFLGGNLVTISHKNSLSCEISSVGLVPTFEHTSLVLVLGVFKKLSYQFSPSMGGAQDKIIGWYEAYIYILVLATY